MANKLYFKYGTVNSSKSANLLMVRHNYIEQGFSVWCGKSYVDDRDGIGQIATRAGLEPAPCHIIGKNTRILNDGMTVSGEDNLIIKEDVVLIDEAQFLSADQILDLFEISYYKPVLCFGLLTDFRQELFEGSKMLIELAESIEKIKTVCECGAAANYTIRITPDNHYRVINGKQIEIGGNDRYKAVCKRCLSKYPIVGL